MRTIENGFAAIGKPVSLSRQEAGYQFAKNVGIISETAFTMVKAVSEHLEKDNPFMAQEVAMQYLDLTGAYRLLSILLTSPELS